MNVKNRGLAVSVALIVVCLAPRASQAQQEVYGTWYGDWSVSWQETQGNQVLMSGGFSDVGFLSIDPSPGPEYMLGLGFHGSGGFGGWTTLGGGYVGPDSARIDGGFDSSYDFENFFFFANYQSILPDGMIVDGFPPYAVFDLTYGENSPSYDPNNPNPIVESEFMSFVGAVPEPSSIVMLGLAVAAGLIYARSGARKKNEPKHGWTPQSCELGQLASSRPCSRSLAL
jgi:hypothetical protein